MPINEIASRVATAKIKACESASPISSDAARIKRVVVSTYQAVSGTGQKAVDELAELLDVVVAVGSTPNMGLVLKYTS